VVLQDDRIVSRHSQPRVIGIDLGGTETKAVLVDGAGEILAERRRPTPGGSAEAGAHLDLMAALVEELQAAAADEAIAALGLVVPGIVDEEHGVAVYSKNLDWSDVPFRDLVRSRFGLPTAFGHDVRAGALAESRLGAARGYRNLVFMPVGTGIAAGLILDGRIYSGGGYAGEIGHVDVGHGEPCGCGLRGCLEAIASASAIARRYSRRVGREVTAAAEVVGVMQAGDPDATAVWDEAVAALSLALAWTAGILAPEAVVIGGGLSLAGDLLFAPLQAALERRLSFQRVPLLVPAALGDQAGCLGATLLALDLAGI
jgi:glucokinase